MVFFFFFPEQIYMKLNPKLFIYTLGTTFEFYNVNNENIFNLSLNKYD